ncbi:MAG: ABC transporter permease [Methanocella sp.]
MNLTRIAAITRKEFIQITRDMTTLRIVVLMPLIMMLLFGYVVNTDVRQVPTAVALMDTGAPARELLEQFRETDYFKFTRFAGSAEEVGQLIQDGVVKAGLVVPSDYSERVNRGEQAQVQVLIDGSDTLVSRASLNTAELLGQVTGSRILTQRLQRLSGGTVKAEPPVEVRARVWYNPNIESVKSNMPGLIGAILQNVTIILIAMAMVRERERGTMEQLIVTPVTSTELILGKLFPYVVIAILQVITVMLVGILWFGMQIMGSLPVLGLSAIIFLLSSLGLGMLISSMAENQVQANQLSLLFVMPSFLLSGYMFPRENMPQVLQWVGLGIPLTYFLDVLRGVVLKGIGFEVLWPQALTMAVYAAGILTLASFRMRRKRLD